MPRATNIASGGGSSSGSSSSGGLRATNVAADKERENDGGIIRGAAKSLGKIGLLPTAALAGAKIGTRFTEAGQALLGFGSRQGENQGRGQNALNALARGEDYGFRGDGIGNAAANLGLDILTDPLNLVGGGTKMAAHGSRLLVEGGGELLAKKAASVGLDAADQAAARNIIGAQIAKGGAGDLAKRSVMDRATRRYAGLEGEGLATERALQGLVKEGRGGVRIAGKTVLSGDTMARGGDVLRKAPAVEMADDAARTMLIPRAGVTKEFGKPTSDILYGAQSKATGSLERHIGESVRPLRAETKANKITQADREGELLSAMERGTPVQPRLQGALDELVAQRAKASATIVDRKLLPEEYLHTPDSYVPRVTTDAGFKAIAKATRKGVLPKELAAVFKVAGSLEARKLLPDATIPEAEAVVQKMLADAGTPLKKGETFFEHDVVKAVVSHGAAVERASGQLGVLETLAGLPGGDALVRLNDTPTVKAAAPTAEDIAKARSKVHTARRGLARTEGRLAQEGPARPRTGPAQDGLERYTLDPVARLALEQKAIDQKAKITALQDSVDALVEARKVGGKANAAADAARKAPEGFEAIKIGEQTAYVHPELAAEINKTKRLVDSNASTQRLTRHIDEVQNFWRAQVTVLPLGTGFFARNFQGNMILNAIDNVGIRDYKDSLRIQRGVSKANREGVPVESILNAADAKLYRAAEGNNVYNQGAQEADLNHVFAGDRVSPAKRRVSPLTGSMNLRDLPVLGTERGPVQAGRNLNAVIENNARLANFIANTRHSGSFEEAARRTRLTLFDYGDLTSAERAVGRRVVPFYTFARKSTGLLLREIAHDPAKLNRITNVLEAGEEATGYEVDSPLDAAAKVLSTPITPGAARNTIGVGGYAGALKQQIVGTTIQDKESGGFTTIAPDAEQSESRLERLGNALMPVYGKYGRVERTKRRISEGDYLNLLLGVRPGDDPVARTPGGGQVLQSKAKTPAAKKTSAPAKKRAGVGPAPG